MTIEGIPLTFELIVDHSRVRSEASTLPIRQTFHLCCFGEGQSQQKRFAKVLDEGFLNLVTRDEHKLKPLDCELGLNRRFVAGTGGTNSH